MKPKIPMERRLPSKREFKNPLLLMIVKNMKQVVKKMKNPHNNKEKKDVPEYNATTQVKNKVGIILPFQV
jgi:hypothetical protein